MPQPDTTLFLETLKIVDGHFVRPQAHRQRINKTLCETTHRPINTPQFSDSDIPPEFRSGTVKCRCIYTAHTYSLTFETYTPRHPHSIQIVDGTGIDYHLKYADRSALDQLLKLRGQCDEIIIVQHGEITDTSYSNIVLSDGTNYVTPRSYLLNGTKRQYLLETRRIQEAVITPGNIRNYPYLYLINAMLNLEDNIRIHTADIHP